MASESLSPERLPGFLDDLDAIVWEADPESLDFLYVNRAAERILGYPVDEWTGTHGFWGQILHPDDRAQAMRFCRSRIDACEDHTFEYRVVHRDGRVVWLRDLVRVTADSDTGQMRIRGTMIDITRRREAERALRESEERFRLLADHIEDLMVLIGEDGRFLYVTPSVETLFGYTVDEALGCPALDFVLEEDRDVVQDALDRVRQGEPAEAVEFRGAEREGRPRWFEAKGWRVSSEPRSRDTRIVAVIRDISERRAYQSELERAGRMEAMGRLAGGIAHDFNNLLTVIRGHAELARTETERDRANEELDPMLHAVQRAQALTGQLLAFSRRDPGSRPERLDLNRALGSMTSMLDRLVGGTVELELELHSGPLPVRIDAGHLEQIVLNLAANARDAMSGGGVLRLRTSRSDVGPPATIRLEVVDEGQGMDPGTLSRVFEPFFTTKPEGEGTGFGLSIVYGLVGQAGGQLVLDSDPGRGTRVLIELPECPLERGGAPRRSTPIEADPRAAPSGLRILVADDEPQLLRLVDTVLRRAGYRVTTASTAAEAYEAFRAADAPFDLVLTDVVMPRGSGVELVDRIREEQPGLPVLFMTGYPGDALPSDVDLPPRTRVLAKPFTPSELQSALADLMED